MKCDSRASLLAHTFISPCFGCELKAKVVTQKMLFQKITYASMASKYISLFFFFVYFSLLSPFKEDDYECYIHFHFLLFLWNYDKRWWQMWHSLSSFPLLMKPGQKTTMNVLHPCVFFFLHCRKQWQASPLIIVFYNSKKKHKNPKEDDELFDSSLSSTTQEKKPWCWFSWVARNVDKLLSSSSSFRFFSSLVEMITSQKACCCFLLFFFTCRRCRWVGILTCHHPWLFAFNCRRWWWASRLIITF